jgi:hypothetical protein
MLKSQPLKLENKFSELTDSVLQVLTILLKGLGLPRMFAYLNVLGVLNYGDISERMIGLEFDLPRSSCKAFSVST